ncbi:hypothetical protein CRUP_017690, partial [Coryphaenoides rupestris]
MADSTVSMPGIVLASVMFQHLNTDSDAENVIGWYRQRRNTGQQMTLRERLVHAHLNRALANRELIFLLLTPSEVTATGSTHETEYAAFILFYKVTVVINNLGCLEDVVYRTSCPPCSAAGYHRVVKKHKSKFFSPDNTHREVMEIDKMSTSMQAELQ